MNADAPSATPPTRSTADVVDLRDALDATRVGGKAAGLARALRAGLRVPAGVVVTVGAPESSIYAAIATLGTGPFAVRSSAVVEDGAARSFAGQLETFLNVAPQDVPRAVAKCIASAAALRAARYAGGDVGGVAVIVQRMVPATCAGVAFSADPRTGERNVVVIEAVRGLGDRLVSGDVTPERWRVDVSTCALASGADDVRVLDEMKARNVAAACAELERVMGSPQDIEWALVDDELHVLQSRPITALPAAPIPLTDAIPDGDWQRDDHHGVLSPLGFAWLQPYPRAMAELMRGVGMPLKHIEMKRVRGHLYQRMVMAGGGGGKAPPDWVLWLVMRLIPSVRRGERACKALLDDEGFVALRDTWERERRAMMRRDIDSIFVARPETLSDDELLARIQRAFDLSARGLAWHAELGGCALFGVGKLMLFIEDELGWDPLRAYELLTGASASTTDAQRSVSAIAQAHADELAALGAPPRSWAELHRACPKLASALALWLDANKLRVLHYDPKNATLGEQPELVLAMLDAPPLPAHDDTAERARAEAAAKLAPDRLREFDRLVALAREMVPVRDENGVDNVSRPAGLLRWFVLELGRRIEKDIGAREHAVYLEAAEHAPALHRQLPDVRALVERRRGEESWALHHRGPRLFGKPPPPMPKASVFPPALGRMLRIFALIEKGEAPRAPESAATNEMVGMGLGTRTVVARARVLDRPEQITQLRAGEVLVCRITSPELTIGLARAGAIVTNEGGALSHPAIIAREYGITAVLGVHSATALIRTGDLVRVDPIEGTVAVVRPHAIAGHASTAEPPSAP